MPSRIKNHITPILLLFYFDPVYQRKINPHRRLPNICGPNLLTFIDIHSTKIYLKTYQANNIKLTQHHRSEQIAFCRDNNGKNDIDDVKCERRTKRYSTGDELIGFIFFNRLYTD